MEDEIVSLRTPREQTELADQDYEEIKCIPERRGPPDAHTPEEFASHRTLMSEADRTDNVHYTCAQRVFGDTSEMTGLGRGHNNSRMVHPSSPFAIS
eukprot:3907434-Rhodomonas_salina.2